MYKKAALIKNNNKMHEQYILAQLHFRLLLELRIYETSILHNPNKTWTVTYEVDRTQTEK